MQDKHLFEYAAIRVVPRVEREEFFNAGVILYCRSRRFLALKITLSREKALLFCPEEDLQQLEDNLRAFELVCSGGKDGGPIAELDAASRFRWLTATRSTVIQTSKVHPGFCDDPADTLQHLFTQLVI